MLVATFSSSSSLYYSTEGCGGAMKCWYLSLPILFKICKGVPGFCFYLIGSACRRNWNTYWLAPIGWSDFSFPYFVYQCMYGDGIDETIGDGTTRIDPTDNLVSHLANQQFQVEELTLVRTPSCHWKDKSFLKADEAAYKFNGMKISLRTSPSRSKTIKPRPPVSGSSSVGRIFRRASSPRAAITSVPPPATLKNCRQFVSWRSMFYWLK